MVNNMRTLIVIPAYNEELTVGSVVALAKKFGDVLVVDDGSIRRGISSGLCWPSASKVTITSYSLLRAYSKAVLRAYPLPMFLSCRITIAPAYLAISEVLSMEPSSTTRTSPNFLAKATTDPTVSSSL